MKKKKWAGLLAGVLVAAMSLPNAAMAAEWPQQAPVPASLTTTENLLASSSSLLSTNAGAAQGTLPLEERVQILLNGAGITSMQYAMMDNGKLVESGVGGAYSIGSDEPLTTDHLYGIGSTSKMFTTVAMMQLVEDGKVDLDKPVTTYIPEFKMADERYKDITVRMLLNHSSGFAGSTVGNAFLFDDADTEAHDTLLDDLATQTLQADPGAYSVYCNDGFTLAEILIERVSGMRFTDYIHKNITEPLGMTHTMTPQDDFDRAAVARTYNPLTGVETPVDTVNVIGTGGIYANAEDLCRFAQVFTGEEALLSDNSIEATFQPEYANGQWLDVENNTVGYGLGWDSVDLYPFNLYDIQAVTKGGDTYLMHNALVVLPEYGLSAAVSSSGGSSAYCQMLAVSMLLDQLEAKGIITERLSALDTFTPPEQVPLDADLKQYEGNYASSSQYYTLSMDAAGTMTLSDITGNKLELLYCGDGLFKDPTGFTELRFLEENGRTYLTARSAMAINGIGDQVSESYFLEKIPDNDVSKETEEAWAARAGKGYVSVTDKASSQNYMMGVSALGLAAPEDGHMLYYSLLDENQATIDLQIPMTGSRDLMPLRAEVVDGVEYMYCSDGIYQDVASVPTIYPGNAYLTIQKNGYNRWFLFPDSIVGKTITVKAPEDGGFVVFDAAGYTLNQSVATGTMQFVVPEDGMVVFSGDVGDRFDLTLS
ncbi:MAG: serine hydrolase domain-containing protein [Peptococcaceae bacterium]|nr:serine hydrolase domain-containing protein [Peptococcaceae bacterium]